MTETTDGGDKPVLTGLQIARADQSAIDMHTLTLAGRSWPQYLVALLALAALATTIVTIALVIRSNVRRKWLWVLGCLVGVRLVTVNWTTGEMSFQVLNVVLFSAGVVRHGFSQPWLVVVGLPVFALLFLVRHGQTLRRFPVLRS